MWQEKDKYWVFPLIAVCMVIALPLLPFVALYHLINDDKEKEPISKTTHKYREKNPRIKRMSDR